MEWVLGWQPRPGGLIRAFLERLRPGPVVSGLALRLLMRNEGVRNRLDPEQEGGVIVGWRYSSVPVCGYLAGAQKDGDPPRLARIANDALLGFATGLQPTMAYRIDLRFPVNSNADLAQGIRVLQEIGGQYEDILAEPLPQVFVLPGKSGMVVLVLRFWTIVADYRGMALGMKQIGRKALNDVGIVVPNPGRCLHSVREDVLEGDFQGRWGEVD